MSKNFYGATGLIGGTDGKLDDIDGAALVDGDGAIVITASNTYTYVLDVDSAAGESSPDIIEPDANSGDKRWILVSITAANLSLGTGELTTGSINRASGTLTLEIGGTAEQSITSAATTFGGNLIIPDGKTIGQAAGPLIAFDDTNNYLEITGCKVGIGTVSPVVPLQVVGIIQGSGLIRSTGSTPHGATGPGVELQQGTGFGLITSYDRPASGYQPLHFDGSTLTFKASSNIKVTMDSDGNVGIGTASPDTKLQVVGTAGFGDDAGNEVLFGSNGDQSFAGSAGFYPRVLNQSAEPAAGTGATQCDNGEVVIWTDTDDAKCYFCYNHGGTVKTVELVAV